MISGPLAGRRAAIWALARGSAGLGFTPESLAGLRAWYRTDAELFQDSAKTTAAASNGDPVGAWGDQTVNGLDLTQGTAGSRGTLVTGAINGLPAVAFDGSADNLAGYGLFTRSTSSWLTPGGFTNTGLAYDTVDGQLWIGDFTNSKLKKTTLAGAYVAEIALSGQPQGVAYDSSDDTLWWADNAASMVRHITMAGADAGGSFAATLPNGIAYEAASDSLWVVTGGALKRYLCSTGALQETHTPSSYNPDGVAYDASTDSLYLMCDAAAGKHSRIVKMDAADGSIDAIYNVSAWPEDGDIVGSDLYYCADAGFHGGITNGNRVYKVPLADLHHGYTVGTWVNPIGTSGAVWSHGNAVSVSGLGIGFAMLVTSTTNARLFVTGNDSTRVFADRAKVAGWRFLCVVVDDAAHTMSLYDNGALVSTAIDISTVYGSHETYYRHSIGASVDGDSLRPCNCQIAEQVVYADALTADEVALLYAYGTERYGI